MSLLSRNLFNLTSSYPLMLSSIARHVALKNHAYSRLSVRLFSNYYGSSKAKEANNEDDLHRILMDSPPPSYSKLVAHEWRSDTGVGDMVFKARGKDRYLVVEAKLLKKNYWSRKMRKKVQEQANRYGRDWKRMHPSAYVKYATFTNRDGLVSLGELPGEI